MAASELSRRDLLGLLGMGTVAALTSRYRMFAATPYRAPVGLQLYSVRKAIEKDFEGTMRRVADIGFVGVETYALPESVSLERAARVFREVGLKVLGMHVELPVGAQRDAALKLADAYCCDRVIYPGWPQGDKYQDREAMKRTAGIYNEIGDSFKKRGLRFGLHNHWWEFEKTDGVYPFYELLEILDKEIFFEIDTYWAKTGGQDPAKVVKDFGKRAPLLHIKDGPAIKGEKSYEQVPAGQGVMDFSAIVQAGGDDTLWMVVEFDEYAKDIIDGLKASYTYLTGHGLADGKV